MATEAALADVKLRDIALSRVQKNLLLDIKMANGAIEIQDRQIRTADVLIDYGLAEHRTVRGRNHILITRRGRRWYGERKKAGRKT